MLSRCSHSKCKHAKECSKSFGHYKHWTQRHKVPGIRNLRTLKIQRLESWGLCCIQLLRPKYKYNVLRLNVMSWKALHGSLGPRSLDPKLLLQSLAHLHLEWPSSGHWVPSPRSNVYIYSSLKNFNSCTAVFSQLIIFTADYLPYTTQTIA